MLRKPYAAGDLVLFTPPTGLLKLVSDAGGTVGYRDLFVKRVAAVAGDRVELLPTGEVAVNGVRRQRSPLACAQPPREAVEALSRVRVVPDDSLFVLGDCEARSTDIRAWGLLPTRNVIARPVVRIWPPGRQGAIE